MILQKDGKTIMASPKAYRIIYKDKGYTPADKGIGPEMHQEQPEKPLEDMEVKELKELAKAKGIEGAAGLKKDELLLILKGGI